MARKVVFVFAAGLVFVILDEYWLFPPLFASLPLSFSWFFASLLAGIEVLGLFLEWQYLDASPLHNPFDFSRKNRRRFQNLRSDF